MNIIINLLLAGISNVALSITDLSLAQCCSGAIYQPSVDAELKERAFCLVQERRHKRRQAVGKGL